MLDTPLVRHDADFGAPIAHGPRLERRVAQPYVAVEVEAPIRDWAHVADLVRELTAWLRGRGIPTAGAPFLRHWTVSGGDRPCHLEVGVPIPHVADRDDRMHTGFIPAGRYAVIVHCGHPDRICESRQLLEGWGARNGVAWQTSEWDDGQEVWRGRFEFHLTDAAARPDPAEWRIEIAYLVHEPAVQSAHASAEAVRLTAPPPR